ncbi:MAG TPA: DUF2239 family protein [Rhizomicrobium sp.]
MSKTPNIVAFAGDVCIAAGDLSCVALAAQKAIAAGMAAGMAAERHDPVLLFDARTSEPVELDLRGSRDDVLRRLPPAAAPEQEVSRGPGRPKLGVVPREVTLLPRHWDWLGSQPGGASVALRKLVENAMRSNTSKDRMRAAQNAAYKFMSVMAGNRPGFEEASRALFAADAQKFSQLISAWPKDIGDHLKTLAADAMKAEESAA